MKIENIERAGELAEAYRVKRYMLERYHKTKSLLFKPDMQGRLNVRFSENKNFGDEEGFFLKNRDVSEDSAKKIIDILIVETALDLAGIKEEIEGLE